jgi:hypothetical protein
MQIQLASQSCCQHLSSLRSGSPLRSIGSLGDLPARKSCSWPYADREAEGLYNTLRQPAHRRRHLPDQEARPLQDHDAAPIDTMAVAAPSAVWRHRAL